jgi:DNA-binding protein H-NS
MNSCTFFFRLLIAILTISTAATSRSQEVTAPPNTPREHKSAAVKFAQLRARTLDAVDRALKNTRVNGDSKNDSVVGSLSDIIVVSKRNSAALKTDINAASAPEKQAMEALIEIYSANYTEAKIAQKSATKMLMVHDVLYLQIEALEQAQKNSEARRKRCLGYAETLTNLSKQAAQASAYAELGGSDLQKAMTAVNNLVDNFNGKQAMAELLDQGVRVEQRRIESFLRENDPRVMLAKMNEVKSNLKHKSKAWITYRNKWLASLKSHTTRHDRAYDDFKKSIQKPWLDLFKTYPAAKLRSFGTSFEQTVELLEQLDERQEEVQREKQKKRREAAQGIREAERRIKSLTSNIARVERLTNIQKDKLKSLENGDGNQLERSISSLEAQIERLQNDLSVQKRILADLQFKIKNY